MEKHTPPQFYKRLLKWFCKESVYDELQGDLEENFYNHVLTHGIDYANKKYKKELIHLFRPSVIRKVNFIEKFNSNLLWHYTNLASRNLLSNKKYTSINLIGLVMGITTATLIFQFNKYEESYDAYHNNAQEIYRLKGKVVSMNTGELINEKAATFFGVHSTIQDEIAEVINVTTFYKANGILNFEDQSFNEDNVLFTTAATFDIFSFPIIAGSIKNFDRPGTLAISTSMAKKMFGEDNPIGKHITYYGLRTDATHELTIEAVFEDIRDNSYIKANAFISMVHFENYQRTFDTFAPIDFDDVIWRWNEFYTFIQLHKDASVAESEEKINAFYTKYRGAYDQRLGRKQLVNLQPLSSINLTAGIHNELTPTNNKELIDFFYLIGILVLLIAWFNYVNITTAIAIKRSKEVGIRKILGAYKRQLILQFLVESLLLNIIAMLAAILLLYLIIPYFQSFIGKDVFAYPVDFQQFWGILAFSFLSGALIAGLYPSIVLSSFKPINIFNLALKKNKQGFTLRKLLVVFQFMVSILLISGAGIIHSQMEFVLTHDKGFSMEQTVVVPTPPRVFRDTTTYPTKVQGFIDKAEQHGNIKNAVISSLVPGGYNNWRNSCTINNDPDQEAPWFSRMSGEHDFLNAYEMEIIAGRGFEKNNEADKRGRVIVNLKAVKNLGFNQANEIIGEEITFHPNQGTFEVIGVMDNFFQNGMHSPIEPMSFQLDSTYGGGFISVKVNGNIEQTISYLEEQYQFLFPKIPFNYFFLDDSYEAQYQADRLFQSVFNIFTFVSIIIACLGLFGLSTFFAIQKQKEVSVRKVLGAKSFGILRLLLQEYGKLMAMAAILGLPLAYFLTKQWLDNFAFKVELNVLTFILPIILLAIVILLTVGFRTWKLAHSNPVNHLKND